MAAPTQPSNDDQLFFDKRGDFLDFYSAGMSMKSACNAIGISPSTFGKWVRRGEAELKRMDPDKPGAKGKKVKASEIPYVDFVREYRRQQGTKTGKAELNLFKGATKGFTIKETKTIVFYDEDGNEKGSQEEEKIKELPPDMRSLQWWLKHNEPDAYGEQAQRVEFEDVTPEEGRKPDTVKVTAMIAAVERRKISADEPEPDDDDDA